MKPSQAFSLLGFITNRPSTLGKPLRSTGWMQGTIMDIGHASGPLLAGFLIAHLSYQGAFVIIAGIQVLAVVVFWVMVRR